MFAYSGMILIPAFLALVVRKRRVTLQLMLPFFVLFVLFIGLRNKVGMDWNNYQAILWNVSWYTFTEALSTSEPGFTVLAWISSQAGFGIYGVNFFAALVFSLGLFSICRIAREPWLALVAAIPYLVVVVAMSGTRQSIAIGIVFLLVANWHNFGVFRRVGFILAASLFHLSAIFLLVFVIWEARLSPIRRFSLGAILGCLSVYILSMPSQMRHVQYYHEMYVGDTIHSPGALAHVLLLAVPGSLYLLNRRVWIKRYGEDRLLFMMSILCLASVPGILVSSTAVDRMSLYLWSVPMLVYAGLPYLLRSHIHSDVTRFFVIFLNIAVLAVWLNYANNANAYLPYGNILF